MFTEGSNSDYAQGKKFKITIINMFKKLKENVNKFWDEDQKNINF